jgi:hypothetical protein
VKFLLLAIGDLFIHISLLGTALGTENTFFKIWLWN